MNIKITYNWLLEYLDTGADPYEIQKYLSLSGPSVEKVEKKGDDYVFDIEITSNRVDAASVFGIAQEAQAILPQFGKKAKLKLNPLTKFRFKNLDLRISEKRLNIQIKNQNLCSRFAAIVLSNIEIKKSPNIISERLKLCGINSLNNIVDISNYLMLALGQPTHVFDYDKIGKHTMILRESKKGEKIITLDEKEFILPGGDIVIEDGNGKLIDLCGIMGGLNSSVTDKTKNVVLFVQTYNKQKIRKTSMITGQRSEAATYFEKGLDEERVEPTLVYGIGLLEKYSGATISSQLCDIYPKPFKSKTVSLSLNDVGRLIGVEIDKSKIKQILSNLGFSIKPHTTGAVVQVGIPSWRKDDISIKKDLIEEITRIYGYHNLPSILQPMIYVKQPKEMEELFTMQSKIKYFLKHLGLNEVMNYSMISQKQIIDLGLDPKNHLKLSNPITDDLKFMRTSLLFSLIKNIQENQGKRDVLKLFEIAKVYYSQKNSLPLEIYKLGIATNTNFFDLKGILEALLTELNINNYVVRKSSVEIFISDAQAEIVVKDRVTANFGQLKYNLQIKNTLKNPVFLAGMDVQSLIEFSKLIPQYKPLNPYATIKLDLTAPIPNFAEFKKNALKTSSFLLDLKLNSTYGSNVTVGMHFAAQDRNLTEKEALLELEKIKKLLK